MTPKATLFGSAAFSLVCVGAIGLSGRADSQILGSADSYAVLGGSEVTNTGATTINGDVGVYSGTSITGFSTVTFIGASTVDLTDAKGAQAADTNAYNILKALPFTTNLTGQNLGGQTLTPGVYNYSSSAQLTGALTLNFAGASNQEFVFQIGSTLTTASASDVIIENPGTNDGVFFQVGSSATLGSSTLFEGNILALTDIVFDPAAEILCGRAFAQNGKVTMIGNTISNGCTASGNGFSGGTSGSGGGGGGSGGGGGTSAPEINPASAASALTLLLGSLLVLRGRMRALPSESSLA